MTSKENLAASTGINRPPLALIAGPLALLSPLVIFLQHTGYPLLGSVGFRVIIPFLLLGLVFGAGITWGGRTFALILASILVTFVIDIQSDLIGTKESLAVVLLVLIGALWIIQDNLALIFCIVFGCLFFLTVLFPVPPAPLWDVKTNLLSAVPKTPRPAVVHIILDEHIGLEAIPREFDPEGALGQEIRESFISRGYRVFGRAYSRFYFTSTSIPNAFNFTANQNHGAFVDEASPKPVRMNANKLLALLRSRGYSTHVYQSDFLDYCEIAGSSTVNFCATYTLENVGVLRDAPLSVSDKVRFVLASYLRLSYVFDRMRTLYRKKIRNSTLGRMLHLPHWPNVFERVSAISAMHAVKYMKESLRNIQPGQAFLVHLMLPHFPYVFDSQCEMSRDGSSWLNGYADEFTPRRNNNESRAQRYPLYLAQLSCTHRILDQLLSSIKASKVGDNAAIIIHGDHGSRIDKGPPNFETEKKLTPTDYIDGFATFFAARIPKIDGGYDRRPLSLDTLLSSIYRDETFPTVKLKENSTVFIRKGKSYVPRPLPPFNYGNLASQW